MVGKVGQPFLKGVAIFCAILLPLVFLGEVTSSPDAGYHCGMSQCDNCCPQNGPQSGNHASSCLCLGLTCVPSTFQNPQIRPSSSFLLEGTNPVRRLFIPAIFHPPQTGLLLFS